MSRATACFSMYSDMSMRTIACSESKRNSARARAVSVFPTPVGPRKMKEPIGRLGSCRPARELPLGVGHLLPQRRDAAVVDLGRLPEVPTAHLLLRLDPRLLDLLLDGRDPGERLLLRLPLRLHRRRSL